MSPRDSLSGALDSVMSRFTRLLRSVGRRRGLGDADLDEMEQEVRLRLWRALATSDRIMTAKTSYIYQTAMSATLDLIRRRRARPEEDLEVAEAPAAAAAPGEPGPDALYEQSELGARIDRAVDELDEPRDVVVRLHLSGYHREEIAQLLGWTEPKVRNLLYRGLEDLRALLVERGIGPRRIA
jgi:RNA polymerase sigma-70 factor (ECF subfamily)